MSQPLYQVVTHAGSFHSDEVMALALLKRFFFFRPLRLVDFPKATLRRLWEQGERPVLPSTFDAAGREDARAPHWVIRTRDADLLALARRHAETFVIDVGGEFDADRLNFDHHQDSMKDTWPDGTALSSTGLIWNWLKAQGHLTSLPIEIQGDLEKTLIRPLDAHDNGLTLFPLAEVCEGFNRLADSGEQLEQFEKALSFMEGVFDNFLHLSTMKLTGRRVLEHEWAAAQRRGETFVVLKEPLAYADGTGLLREVSGGQATLLGIAGRGNRYSLISLPQKNGDRFSIKCPFPEAWRGRMDFTVDLEGRPVTLAFVHKTGFMGVVQGGPEDVRRVARGVLSEPVPAPSEKPPSRKPG